MVSTVFLPESKQETILFCDTVRALKKKQEKSYLQVGPLKR